MKATPRIFALATALLLGLACGGQDIEDELAAATQALDEARARVDSARSVVEERTASVDQAQAELDEARQTLREAEEALSAAQASIGSAATDAVVFRAVQRRLLDDDGLNKVAISARVERGVVTLTGRVPDERLRERAVGVARTAAGVVDVEDRIVVEAPAKQGT